MPTTVTDAYTVMANAIETVVAAEFSDDSTLIIKHDRLHGSVGSDGRTYVGISPEREPTFDLELQIEVLIQFYGGYKADVNPFQEVDPRVITNKAERLRQALGAIRIVGTSNVWYFDVDSVSYPPDATGNKSRFEMSIIGRGNNSGLIETT